MMGTSSEQNPYLRELSAGVRKWRAVNEYIPELSFEGFFCVGTAGAPDTAFERTFYDALSQRVCPQEHAERKWYRGLYRLPHSLGEAFCFPRNIKEAYQ